MSTNQGRHQEVLDRSLQLIYQKGFKATTMRDIATELDCDVANLYNYIESKQSLLEKFLFDISRQFHEGMDDIVSAKLSSDEKIRALVRLNVRLSVEQPLQLSLLVNEWRHLKGSSLSRFTRERSQYERKVTAILKSGMEAGTLRHMDLDLATHLVLSSLRWLFNKQMTKAKKTNPLELERQIYHFLIHGLQGP